MNVAINGFGRIGRLALRAFLEHRRKYNFKIIAVNDLGDIDSALHLLKYDSVHGELTLNVQKISATEFSIEDESISYFSEKSPEMLPWKRLKIDVVLECTGILKTKEACRKHLAAGAAKVLISAPSEDADKTVVFGVNEDTLDLSKDTIISNASCTTNCLAPIVKIIREKIEIVNGFMMTIHSYTGDQRLIDTAHKDLRRARAAAANIIPTSTGATNAIEKIFPELAGKLSGLAVRVPTSNVSMLDFTFTTKRKVSAEEINKIIRENSEGKLKNILGYTQKPLVSSDFNHSPLSATVDLPLTKVIDGTTIHLVAWYDNEWGFSNRMLDVVGRIEDLQFHGAA
ncbi:MAG: type I glyceraldehyde-3-phosphate dehydrogenase [Holosporaceae bacterium]|jgi:glyceraldehyde 3-phosphate dehydrogenase|nr:type I glyceraldehyde-3-phosphate dehydrogenase [Holosporaceae bacterium]